MLLILSTDVVPCHHPSPRCDWGNHDELREHRRDLFFVRARVRVRVHWHWKLEGSGLLKVRNKVLSLYGLDSETGNGQYKRQLFIRDQDAIRGNRRTENLSFPPIFLLSDRSLVRRENMSL